MSAVNQTRILVTNLPEGISQDFLPLYFESPRSGNQMKCDATVVEFDERKGAAILEYKDEAGK